MVDHFSTYIYQKRGFFYFSRRVPKEVQQCHSKQRIVLALNTRSRAKALKYSQVICQRLDERWLPMRLDALGLGNVMANDVGCRVLVSQNEVPEYGQGAYVGILKLMTVN
jgi:hypothetical protein